MTQTDPKIIATSKGGAILVDAQDYDLVKHYTWHVSKTKGSETPYAVAHSHYDEKGNQKLVKMHHLITQDTNIDHINGNGLDNRRANLRKANAYQNSWNSKSHAGSKSKYKGVSWNKERQKWKAQITCKGTHYNLGHFDTEEAAAKVYDARAKKLHGKFARLNFSKEEGSSS